jgi:hypothetical protein
LPGKVRADAERRNLREHMEKRTTRKVSVTAAIVAGALLLVFGFAGATSTATPNVVSVKWTNIGDPGDVSNPSCTGYNTGQAFATWCYDVISEASSATTGLSWSISKAAGFTAPLKIVPSSGTIVPGQSLTIVVMTNECGYNGAAFTVHSPGNSVLVNFHCG